MNVLTFNEDIYDLFYEKHSIKDVTYLLMNKKILLFQKYETISANEGTVFSDFTSNDNTGNLAKIKSNFINDDNFDKKDNYEKNYYCNRSYENTSLRVYLQYTHLFSQHYTL